MRPIRILDVGSTFGMSGARVFGPWKPLVRVPRNLKEIVESLPETDLVIFGGGGDVHPDLYGHRNIASHVGDGPSDRDVVERMTFEKAKAAKIPMFGICRGAQLVCALSGGTLIQHITGHSIGGEHQFTGEDGKVRDITSLHHQMLCPINVKHELLGWTINTVVKKGDVESAEAQAFQERYGFQKMRKMGATWDSSKQKIPDEFWEKEPEIVYFPTTNCLAVQGHPEFMNAMDEAVIYIRKLAKLKLFEGNKELLIGDEAHATAANVNV